MKTFRLDSEPKLKPGFKIPENYFETLTDKVMQQLPEKEVKVVPLYKRKYTWISAVAAIFIIALGISLYFRMSAPATQPDAEAIENYLVYQANISSYELMQNLDTSDIKELEQSITLNDEAIEDYLYENNISVN